MTFFLEERQRIKMKRNEKISFYQHINLVQSKQSPLLIFDGHIQKTGILFIKFP